MSDERTVCRSCHAIEFGMIPIDGEWSCCDCLSKSDAMEEIKQLTARLAAAEAEPATDRTNLAAWVVRNLDKFGCFTGDCPHWEYTECIKAIIDNYEADAAAKAGGCDDARRQIEHE